jgi:hypothetical protein
MFKTKVVEESKMIKTKIVEESKMFSKNRAVYEIMWNKYVGQATADNMAQAHCMLDT